MTSIYKTYTIRELREFAHTKTVTPVHLVLDRVAVDYLLSLNTNNRRMSQKGIDALINSIRRIGWKSTESLCVTELQQLGNGQHRLTALKQLGYPDDICATVIFGVDKDSVLVIDQHVKRTASATLKIAEGKSCSSILLSAIRNSLLINPNTLTISTGIIPPSTLASFLDEWELYSCEMPLLFHRQIMGTKNIALTSAMIVAIVQYRQRAGVSWANHFLEGFWGERDCSVDSPESKARNFRLTVGTIRGSQGASSVYRIFVWLLLAHYEGRKNPRLCEATDWGVLKYAATSRQGRAS